MYCNSPQFQRVWMKILGSIEETDQRGKYAVNGIVLIITKKQLLQITKYARYKIWKYWHDFQSISNIKF